MSQMKYLSSDLEMLLHLKMFENKIKKSLILKDVTLFKTGYKKFLLSLQSIVLFKVWFRKLALFFSSFIF